MITTQYWADHIWRAAVWSVGRVIGWSERINSGHSTFLHGCTSTLDKYREWQEITGSGVSCASSPNSLGVAFLVAPFWEPKSHFETPKPHLRHQRFRSCQPLDQVMFSLVKRYRVPDSWCAEMLSHFWITMMLKKSLLQERESEDRGKDEGGDGGSRSKEEAAW